MSYSICGPAILYIIISIISLLLQYSTSTVITVALLVHIIFIILWTLLLFWLCQSNWSNLAWALVTMPYVIGFFILRIILEDAISDPSTLLDYGTPMPKTPMPTTPIPTSK